MVQKSSRKDFWGEIVAPIWKFEIFGAGIFYLYESWTGVGCVIGSNAVKLYFWYISYIIVHCIIYKVQFL